MRCLVKNEPKVGVWFDERPIPTITDNEVLIKIKKMSICGTDVHIYKWDSWAQRTVPLPLIIGHEFVGEIVELGKSVSTFKIGDRVSGEGHITCGTCTNCRKGLKHLCMNCQGVGYHRTGCFAEYFALPAENVFLIPTSVPDDLAAIFDPFGNSTHTALATNLAAEDVLITGAGPTGLMAAAIARHCGARSVVVTDINPYRLQLAHEMGATAALDVSKIKLEDALPALNIHNGFTVGMEMSGSAAGLNSLLQHCQHGAHISILGIYPEPVAINWDLVIFKMLTLKGIYGREVFKTWYDMTHLLEGGLNIAPVITHHVSFDDFEEGFQAMLSGKAGKVIVEW